MEALTHTSATRTTESSNEIINKSSIISTREIRTAGKSIRHSSCVLKDQEEHLNTCEILKIRLMRDY